MICKTATNYHTTALMAVLLAASAGCVQADSLFPTKAASQAARGSSAATPAFLFSDTRAHSVGDPLLVTVSENTSASSSANTKTSQNDSVDVFGGAGLFSRVFKQLALSAQNSRNGTGAGTTTRSGSLVTTLSVLVKEVLPNGTLRIEGSRFVTINRETQRVVFSGIVRPEDVGPDNTIPSNLVAAADVRYEGKGVVSEHQRQGILTRIFRFLF